MLTLRELMGTCGHEELTMFTQIVLHDHRLTSGPRTSTTLIYHREGSMSIDLDTIEGT